MKKCVFYSLILMVTSITLSCGEAKRAAIVEYKESPSTGDGGPTTVTDVDGVLNNSPLYFKLGVAWEQPTVDPSETDYSFSSACFIAPGAVVGNSKTCTITIPEQKLYYSYVRFRVGTLTASTCSTVKFQPYYYRRSDKLIINQWDTTQANVNCTGSSRDKACWGGAAPILLDEDWENNSGFYFLPAVGNQMDYTLKSGNAVRQMGTTAVNWLVVNDITNSAVGQVTPAADPGDASVPTVVNYKERMPGQWVNYSVVCSNLWGEALYTLNIVISDENTVDEVNGGTEDTYEDWP